MDNKNLGTKIISFGPLTRYSETVDGKYGTLSWSIRKGYPRITVYTENYEDKTKRDEFSFDKLITAPMDGVIVGMVISNLKLAYAATKEFKASVKCFNTKFVNNEPTNEVILQATIIIGKDKEGVVYLAAIEDGKKKLKFKLLPNPKWHKFYNDAGDEITDQATLSVLYAKAYTGLLETLMNTHLAGDAKIKYQLPKGAKSGTDDGFPM